MTSSLRPLRRVPPMTRFRRWCRSTHPVSLLVMGVCGVGSAGLFLKLFLEWVKR